jgi:hypothetical protein
MRHNSYCDICGESYHEDNLERCKKCGKDYCYRCGSSDHGKCKSCCNEEAGNAAKDAAGYDSGGAV